MGEGSKREVLVASHQFLRPKAGDAAGASRFSSHNFSAWGSIGLETLYIHEYMYKQ